MNGTPSALKWLAEKRARLANDALQTGRMVAELTERHQKLQSQLAALDETIKVYDDRLDPTRIAPVAGWPGKCGKRGALRQALMDVLQTHAGADWVSSENIERALIAKVGLDFESAAHRTQWHRFSFRKALQRLANDGTAERRHDANERTGKHGYWRLRQPEATSLADL
ncbi:MAG: hypothetical protein KGL99_05795 [Burkholderiales bacterium]|nr:hypothetical protein [Burkholderiales bacterium]MDE2300213.1 hypothetical protein [Burkholderiales bacterium]MDE2626649.1 hypothetical protein [Burkholderiales bacterium]